jgi:hypothetical protein
MLQDMHVVDSGCLAQLLLLLAHRRTLNHSPRVSLVTWKNSLSVSSRTPPSCDLRGLHGFRCRGEHEFERHRTQSRVVLAPQRQGPPLVPVLLRGLHVVPAMQLALGLGCGGEVVNNTQSAFTTKSKASGAVAMMSPCVAVFQATYQRGWPMDRYTRTAGRTAQSMLGA